MRRLLALAVLLVAAPFASAHGDLEINETEILVLSDFEGFEDAFPWGGFEIWDVYVGEGYDEKVGSDGVYVKANFAGSGETRPPGQSIWSATFRFAVGETTVERSFEHDGAEITSDFDAFQSAIADGNVLQVKGWVALPDAAGKTLTDLVVVTAVDGAPRDVAPGGYYSPAGGAEIPFRTPATPIFPETGRGRIVDAVELAGPTRFFAATATPSGGGAFKVSVTNALAKQGQHVHLSPAVADGWRTVVPENATLNLKGGESGAIGIAIELAGAPGDVVPPLRVDVVSDIGGRATFLATLVDGEIRLVPEAEGAGPATIPSALNPAPAAGTLAALCLAGLAALARRR